MIVNMLAQTALELNESGIEVGFTDLGSDLCDKINQRIGPNQTTVKFLGKIPGDWINDGDLLLNAWDPHSLLGNKLAVDNSIDGFIGRSTLIHFMHALICSMYNAGVIEKPPATSQGIAPVTENNNASGRIPPPTDPALNVNAV